MSDVNCARMLLDSAKRDIDAIRVMYPLDEVSDEILGFHVQQAAEKLIKAWIALLGEVYPLTHDIEGLFGLLAERGTDVKPFARLVDFTPYAVEFRYASVDPGAEPIDRAGALAHAEALLERVGGELAALEKP